MRNFLVWVALALIGASAFWINSIRLIHSQFSLFLLWLVVATGIAIFLALFSASNQEQRQDSKK